MADSEEPIFMAVDGGSDGYQKTIDMAKSTVPLFKEALGKLKEDVFACVKFFVPQDRGSEKGVNLWLMHPHFKDGYCYAKPFELPKEFTWIQVGKWIEFCEDDLLDWYLLSDSGDMLGGYSLRYQRSKLPAEKQAEYDDRLGVKRYL